MPVQRALISVYDKSGLPVFARALAARGVEIVSTGGTALLLREAGIAVRDVSDLTGWPEMLGGRVKTLHPKVHGGILFRRGDAGDKQQTAEHKIAPIDLVVVNLYPFEATAAKSDLTAGELIENIDIGGPTMVRSAAKNFESVAVVTDPADYAAIASEITATGAVSLATRLDLARKAFAHTARYDGTIATELERLSAAGGSVELATISGHPAPARTVAFRFHAPAGTAVRRESAPARGTLRARGPRGRNLGRACIGNAITRQGTFLQQSRGPRSGARTRSGIQPSRRRDRETQQSLRHRRAGNAGRGVYEGFGVRSGFRVWRSNGVQSTARSGHGRGSREVIRRMHRRAGLRTRGA